MNKKELTLAIFDCDGTLTTRDTLRDFLWHSLGPWKVLKGCLRSTPYLVGFVLRVVPNWKAKQELFTHLLGGMLVEQFVKLGAVYATNRLPQLIRPAALEKLQWHVAQGHQVVILSASVAAWLQPWASSQGISAVVGTELEIKEGRLTGKLAGKNCYGPEKVVRLQKYLPKYQEYETYAYGDSRGDRELLAAVDHPFFKTF